MSALSRCAIARMRYLVVVAVLVIVIEAIFHALSASQVMRSLLHPFSHCMVKFIFLHRVHVSVLNVVPFFSDILLLCSDCILSLVELLTS